MIILSIGEFFNTKVCRDLHFSKSSLISKWINVSRNVCKAILLFSAPFAEALSLKSSESELRFSPMRLIKLDRLDGPSGESTSIEMRSLKFLSTNH